MVLFSWKPGPHLKFSFFSSKFYWLILHHFYVRKTITTETALGDYQTKTISYLEIKILVWVGDAII